MTSDRRKWARSAGRQCTWLDFRRFGVHRRFANRFVDDVREPGAFRILQEDFDFAEVLPANEAE